VVRGGFLALVCGFAIIALAGVAGAVESTEVVAPAEDAATATVSEATSSGDQVVDDANSPSVEAEATIDASGAEADVTVQDVGETELSISGNTAEVSVAVQDTQAQVSLSESGVEAGVTSQGFDVGVSVSASSAEAQIGMSGTEAQVSVSAGTNGPGVSGGMTGAAGSGSSTGFDETTDFLPISIAGDDSSSGEIERVDFGRSETGTITGGPVPHAFIPLGSIGSDLPPMLDSPSTEASIGQGTTDEPADSAPALPATTYPGMSSVSGGSSFDGHPDPFLLATSLMFLATGVLWRTRARCRPLRSRSVAAQPLPG
jgi:hypothetical protein